MKRFTRRAAAVVVGIVLGWYVAGVVSVGESPVAAPGPGASYAQASDTPPHDAHGDHADTADEGYGTPDAHGAHDTDAEHDAALAAAGQLVPGPQDIPWFRPMLYVAAGLFVAAIVLGIPALKLRGPEVPDPADTHSH